LTWQTLYWFFLIYLLSSHPNTGRGYLLNEVDPEGPGLVAYKKNCDFTFENIFDKIYDVITSFKIDLFFMSFWWLVCNHFGIKVVIFY
jgi:hypothetical protein